MRFCYVGDSTGFNREVCIAIISLDKCPAENVTDSKGPFNWPETRIGESATHRCRYGSVGNSSNTGFANRHCDGSYIDGSYWNIADTTNCEYESVATRRLRDLSEVMEWFSWNCGIMKHFISICS